MKRGRQKLVVVASVLVLGAGTFAFFGGRGPLVEVVAPATGPVTRTLALIGRVAPPAEISFIAPEPTTVTGTPVAEGQHLEAGALVLQMDDDEAASFAMQARAQQAQAQARTRQVRTVTSKTAELSLRESQAQLQEAEATHARGVRLFESGSLVAAELDQARTALTVARTRARAAELQAAALSPRGADWQLAAAAEAFADAGLMAAEKRLQRLRVLAPAPGVLVRRDVDVGDAVTAGAPLATMVLDGRTKLVVEPDERALADLALGQTAVASTEAFPEQTFHAVVSYIAPSVDRVRGTIEVHLRVPEPPAYLKNDMTVSVDIIVAEAPAVTTLPAAAIHDLATSEPWIALVRDGVATRRPVQVGLRGQDTVEVRDALDADAQVIVSDPQAFELGARVRVR